MKVLIVDNNRMRSSWGASGLVREAVSFPGVEVTVRRAPERDLPKIPDVRGGRGDFDAVIVSGSITSCLEENPWVTELDAALRRWVDRKTPLLGVCYGHQSIVRVLGGRALLRKSPEPEVGWTEVIQSNDNAIPADRNLWLGLPEKFWSFSSHVEEVVSLPSDLISLGRSQRCGIQGFVHRTHPVYGIQFHPEKDPSSCESTFADYAAKKYAKGETPIQVLRPKDTAKLYDAEVGKKIFGNFLKFAASI